MLPHQMPQQDQQQRITDDYPKIQIQHNHLKNFFVRCDWNSTIFIVLYLGLVVKEKGAAAHAATPFDQQIHLAISTLAGISATGSVTPSRSRLAWTWRTAQDRV